MKNLLLISLLFPLFVYGCMSSQAQYIEDNEAMLINVPNVGYVDRDIYDLAQILRTRDVRLTVLPGEITHPKGASSDYIGYDNWKKSKRVEIINNTESYIRSIKSKRLVIVDRMALSNVLQEQSFQSSGLVSANTRLALGRMYGITHIMIVDFNRDVYWNGLVNEFTDTTRRRLIDVETGEIITSVSIKVRK